MTALIGHDNNMRIFAAALASGKVHHGWILAGQRGLGKASFAVNSARKLIDPEDRFGALIERGSHPDLITIKRLPKEPPKEGEEVDPSAELKRSIGVDQIRALQMRLTTRPGLSDKRAIIIDCADDFERSAANALLKSLEEPPAGTFFFLVSHSSDRLLPTIRSRCQLLRFEPLNDLDMEMALANIAPELGPQARAVLVAAGNGSPGQAIEFLGLDLEQLETDMNAIIVSGDPSNELRVKLAGQLSLKNAQPRYEAFLRRVPQKIAECARQRDALSVASAVEAWETANALAARAIGVTLDKQTVVFQMGSLLASLQTHKHLAS
jgi:DNA polymerase III subunit delta'